MDTAVLDACVLFRGGVRDFLLWVAEAAAFSPAWSDIIHEEWMRSRRDKFGDPMSRLIYAREEMENAFPGANFDPDPQTLNAIDLPDMDDKGNPPGKSSPEIVGLSSVLNRIAGGGSKAADYRNPNGVYMKLMNFRRFDPIYQAQGKTGLTRGNKLEETIWNVFASDAKRLAQTATAIGANVESIETSTDEVDGIEEAEEGRVLTRAHLVRERSRKLVDAKKAEFLRTTGTLACEACGFDFKVIYGDRGQGFIEVHHAVPVHQLDPGTKTRLADLHLLCANCHRMIHARRPWLTLNQLRACFQSRKQAGTGC